MLIQIPRVGRFASRALVLAALGGAAALAATLCAPTEAAAQSTTRPEFIVGTPLTAKSDHTLGGGLLKLTVKTGTTGKVTKVTSSGGNIISVDVQIGARTIKAVPVATVRANYTYPK